MALRATICELDFASSVLGQDRVLRRGAWVSDGARVAWLGPWESLGEQPVEFYLSQWARGQDHRLIAGAKRMLEWSPGSPGVQLPLPGDVAKLSSVDEWLGFRPSPSDTSLLTLKIKVSPKTIVPALNTAWQKLNRPSRLRLDANNQFSTSQEFLRFWDSLDPGLRDSVEFIEEPTPYRPGAWDSLASEGLRLALDRDLDAYLLGDESVTHFVVKPLVHNPWDWAQVAATEMKRLVISHNMDPDLAFDYCVDVYWQINRIHPLLMDAPGLGTWHQGVKGTGSVPSPELPWRDLAEFK